MVVAAHKDCLEGPAMASVIEWKSHRLRRVCRSTLSAEAAASDAACDHAAFMSFLLSELLDGDYVATKEESGLIPVVPATDCKSLYDSVRRLSTQFQEKRVQIDITALRETASHSMRWVPTDHMLADGLTKRDHKLRNGLRLFMNAPTVSLKEQLPDDKSGSTPADES